MNPHAFNQDREGTAYSGKYLIIPVMGTLLIGFMFVYLNSERFTLPGIIPWPDSGPGKVFALVGQYVLVFLPILLLCCGSIALTALIPLFHPIFEQVRQDWSLMSFMLYGLSLFMVMLSSEYRGLELYQLACLGILGIGALLYLSPANSWVRFVKLIAALTVSMAVLGAGIYLIYPQQSWSTYTTFPRWWEAVWPFLVGISLGMNMVVPALLSYLRKD